MALTVTVLRELFRHLQAFRAAYETDGVSEITGPGGETYSLWDIEYLYEQRYRLSARQRQSIELCLVNNVREVEAARIMGVSETNPVAMYATLGLRKLLALIESGELPRYGADERVGA